MLLLTGVLISILLIIIVAYLWHIRKIYSFFERLNIPGPSPKLFFGNFIDIVKTKRVSIAINQWTEKYGRIYGYFEGHTPILVISDPDLLQDIFIKSFSNFHSRRGLPLEDLHAKAVHIFSAPGLRWKRQRFVINPTFSSAKLKQMTPLIHHSVDVFMTKMAEQYENDQPFDIYTYFKRFTMDTIWSCAFGVDTDMQNNIDNPYLVHSQQVFDEVHSVKILVLLSLFITELNHLWYQLHEFEKSARYWLRHYLPFVRKFIDADPNKWIIQQAYKLIDKRGEMGASNRVDLMQLMLESASKEDVIPVIDNLFSKQLFYFLFSQDRQSTTVKMELTDNEPLLIRKLTIPEIAMNIFIFSK
jgi:cytochrome P450